MGSRKAVLETINKVAEKMKHLSNETGLVDYDPLSNPIGIIDINKWEWAQGVGLYGLWKYYQETRDEATLRYLLQWYEHHFEAGLPDKNVNTMCPMLTLSFLYEHTGNVRYLGVCQEWVEWVMNEMPRTEEGGLQHAASGAGVRNDQQLWVDTLFMTVLFLARMGKLLNRQDYLDESVRQFLVHIKYLADKKTGLWFHGWSFNEKSHFSGALWGRGNSWYTSGVVDYIEIVEELNQGVKMYLLDTLLSQVKTLQAVQHQSGMWHTLLDDPGSYLETSATAGVAYGILKAVRKGYLDVSYLETGTKAAKAVMDKIDDKGTVMGVSYGTGIQDTLDKYRKIPICPMTYGQALAIMMLSEVAKLIN